MLSRRLVLAGGLGALAPLTACTGALAIEGNGAGERLARAAQTQLGVTTDYESAYVALDYPGGDVPRETGVCADVLIRAFRDGLGIDLQQRLHEDMTADFAAYPALWGLEAPDANIDHRRVPNLEAWFARQGARLWTGRSGGGDFPETIQTGDLLAWRSDGGASHIAIATRGGDSPLILHNAGYGAMQHALWPMGLWRPAVGHYRWMGEA